MNKALGPIYPLDTSLSRSILNNLYTTDIRLYHDNSDIVFDEHITTHDEQILEIFQNRVARLSIGTSFRTPTNKLRLEIEWETLKIERKFHRL